MNKKSVPDRHSALGKTAVAGAELSGWVAIVGAGVGYKAMSNSVGAANSTPTPILTVAEQSAREERENGLYESRSAGLDPAWSGMISFSCSRVPGTRVHPGVPLLVDTHRSRCHRHHHRHRDSHRDTTEPARRVGTNEPEPRSILPSVDGPQTTAQDSLVHRA